MLTTDAAAHMTAAYGPVYVASDGRSVTDWHGRTIGRVVTQTAVRLAQWSHVHGRTITHYRVKANGRYYYGRSSPGILIRLRPYRRP